MKSGKVPVVPCPHRDALFGILKKDSAVLFEPTPDGQHRLMLLSPGKYIRDMNIIRLEKRAKAHGVALSNGAAPVTLTGATANILALIREIRR